MSAILTTFEVRVEVSVGTKRYKPICYYGKGEWARDKIFKMFHVEANSPRQAKLKAEKHGHPVSCRKLDAHGLAGNIEALPLDNAKYVNFNPYSSAIAMDELIFDKVNKRRKNLNKDRQGA